MDWQEASGEEPESDPLLPVRIEGGKLEIPASFTDRRERDERLKPVLHERLLPKAEALALKAGNLFPRMAGKARVLHGLLDRPFAELDMLAIHLEVEDIDARARTGAEDSVPYDDDLLAAVGAVTRLGPGLTRDNAEVELFQDRLARTRETPVVAEAEEARERLSDAILAQPAAHRARSLALEAFARTSNDPDLARTLREPKQRNMLWRLAAVAAGVLSDGKNLALGVGGSLIATAYGTEITAFVTGNWTLLLEVAGTYGAAFASWFLGTVGVLMIGKGLREEHSRRRGGDGDDIDRKP